MDCPKCKCTKQKKNGKANNRQRYRCLSCGYNFTVEMKSTAKPSTTKRQAIQLYLEGLGFRSIGRFLNVSHVSVQKWVKKYGQELEEIKSDDEISIVEMDEMHTYIGNKKTIAGFGLLSIEMEKGLSTAYLVTGGQRQGRNYGNH